MTPPSTSLIRTAATMAFCLTALTATAADPSHPLLEANNIHGGLVVHLGCGDGTFTASLRANDRYLVHGLDTDAELVSIARKHIRSLELCGKVTIDTFDGERLPYADNLVNLLVVNHTERVSRGEMERVLAPGGVVVTDSMRERQDRPWRKPWPKDIDQWSHFLHDATGNAVAHDSVVGAPKRLQWLGGPLWCRSHEYDSSLCAMVSAGGRMFYIFDEGPTGITDKRIPDKWTLIARDAFNGVILWKRPISRWGWKAWKGTQLEQADWRLMRSQRHNLPLGAPRRLVADGDRVYVTLGYEAPVTELDAATGQTLRTFEGTERADEIIHQNGTMLLLVRSEKRAEAPPEPLTIQAVNVGTGTRLWEIETPSIVSTSLAMNGEHVLFHDGSGVVCIDATSGKRRWRTEAVGGGLSPMTTNVTLIIHDDVVLCATAKRLVALSITDGNTLWQLPGARGFGVANPPDLFVADNLVWFGPGGNEPESITGYDPLTGKPGRTVNMGPFITHGHHARCYRSKATDNFLLLPKRATEFIDIQGDNHSRHNWLRGACRYGVLPCNGLLYATPHPCFCFAGVKMNGFVAAAPATDGNRGITPGSDNTPRLAKGPAHGDIASRKNTPDDASWPMYRHDPKRSGSTASHVGPQVDAAWNTKLGGPLTQPVSADGRLFVARKDAGQIVCLDADTGDAVWNYITGGRIDSSPSYHDGYLIFGSADGYVYALRASDGVLAWRFRAAPIDRRIVAFGQLESPWPVHGSVLILDNTVYLTAGRSSFLDGGIGLYGLDHTTGEILHETIIDGPYPDLKVRDVNAYAMEGSKSDILVTDGQHIYLFHNAFNKRLEKQPTPIKGPLSIRNLGERDFGEHLFSNAGFLDTSGFNRNYWIHTDRWPAFNFAQQSSKAGQLVVFDAEHAYAVKYFVTRNVLSPQAFPATDGYYLFADRNDNRPVAVKSDGKGGPEFMKWLPQPGKLPTCWNLGVGFARAEPPEWVNVIPVRVQAMVRTGNTLFAAGTPDVLDPDDPTGALEGRKGAVLMAFDPEDGKTLMRMDLASPPVFDGMMATEGKLLLSLSDGSVVCLTSQ